LCINFFLRVLMYSTLRNVLFIAVQGLDVRKYEESILSINDLFVVVRSFAILQTHSKITTRSLVYLLAYLLSFYTEHRMSAVDHVTVNRYILMPRQHRVLSFYHCVNDFTRELRKKIGHILYFHPIFIRH